MAATTITLGRWSPREASSNSGRARSAHATAQAMSSRRSSSLRVSRLSSLVMAQASAGALDRGDVEFRVA